MKDEGFVELGRVGALRYLTIVWAKLEVTSEGFWGVENKW